MIRSLRQRNPLVSSDVMTRYHLCIFPLSFVMYRPVLLCSPFFFNFCKQAEQETDKKSSGFGSFFTNLFSSSSSPSAPPTPAQHSASVVSAHSYRTPPPSSYSTPAPAPAPAPSRTYNNLSDCCQIDPVFMSEPVNVDDWDKDEDERFHLFEGFTFHHETPAPSSLNPKRSK